jgi:putative hemolysin
MNLPIILFCFLFGLLSRGAFAGKESSRQRNFWIDGKPVRMIWSAGAESWASEVCAKKKAADCGALRLLSVLRNEKPMIEKRGLSNGQNPSTHLCKKLGGELVLARTEKKSEWFFCRAGDGSMISAAALERIQ